MKVQLRNYPPASGIRVPADTMHRFIRALFERVNMDGSDADHLARVLVNNDLRCVFSHGTRQAATYVQLIR